MARGINYMDIHVRGLQEKSMCGWTIMCGRGVHGNGRGSMCFGGVLDRGCAW